MNDDALNDRRKALEEEFFRREEQRRIDKLRAMRERDEMRKVLRVATGIDTDQALDRLIELGVGPATVTAIGLVPLVAVAWANGKVETGEHDAIMQAAHDAGVAKGSEGEAMLKAWLREKPGAHLVDAWVAYVQGFCERLSPAERARLRDDVLGRARVVAEASGGFLGFGNRVSPEEADVLASLERAFS
ncbi:MAG: hypothetical protein KIT14_09510 [bacterium]|nr:hypothetical protein [bacterium]